MLIKIKNYFRSKDSKAMTNIVMVGLIGIVLLVVSTSLLSPENTAGHLTEEITLPGDTTKIDAADISYEQNLELRLMEVLGSVEGVGKVDVMITTSYGPETVIAEDVSVTESHIAESDSAGGMRENITKSQDTKKILVPSAQGGQQPLVVKELVPKVEGVIIVAEGGSSVLIKEALINAATTVLGVEPHKVQVLKMKNG